MLGGFKMKKFSKLQLTTIFAIIAYLIWEYKVQIWMKTEPTVPIRADLVIILPILAILIILTIVQYVLRRKK